MPTVLITGCSSGIGHHAALALAARGWTVVGTVRKDADRAALEAGGVQVQLLDVTDADACARVVDAVVQQHGGLDAVVANAGIGLFGSFEDVDPDQIRHVFDVNLFGAMNTVRPALPVLRARKGRVVLVSSIAGRRSAPCSGIYNSSKFAVEGWGEALRHELAPFGVPVILIQPGSTASRFAESRAPGRRTGTGVYAAISARVQALQGELSEQREPVETVVGPLVRALEAGRPGFRIPTGRGTKLQLLAGRLLPWPVYEALVQRKLRLPRP